MTFTLDGNGKNYLSDTSTSSKDIFPILDIAEFKCVNTYKAAGYGPRRLERLISLLCHHLKAINNILMPTLSQYVNLHLIRSSDSLYCVTRKS